MKEEKRCTWCGRLQEEVNKLFPGPLLYICDNCVDRLAGLGPGEESALAAQVREEIDRMVQEGFQRIVTKLDLGPLQEKYQRLMRVSFREEPGSPSFQEVFREFKKGVEAVVAADDYQTRYDLAIAYNEMGLREDAFREMRQSLRGALRQKDFDRAAEIMSALLYIQDDSSRVIKSIYQAIVEAGLE